MTQSAPAQDCGFISYIHRGSLTKVPARRGMKRLRPSDRVLRVGIRLKPVFTPEPWIARSTATDPRQRWNGWFQSQSSALRSTVEDQHIPDLILDVLFPSNGYRLFFLYRADHGVANTGSGAPGLADRPALPRRTQPGAAREEEPHRRSYSLSSQAMGPTGDPRHAHQ
jgi:hypothetical protein